MRITLPLSACISFARLRQALAMGKQGQKRGCATSSSEPKSRKLLSLRTTNARADRSISYIQILGTGMDTGDTLPSVLLFFDSKRYVFNAGEGLQRFCQENRIKLSKMDHVLLTRVCSETAGGLAGALLTLAGEVGLTINIWGPSDLQQLVAAYSTFLPNASVLYTHGFGRDGKLISGDGNDADIAVVLEDDVVKISAVLLVPSTDDQAKSLKAGDVAVVYICELPEVKGKFDPVKAAALGLRPGPKYAQLQNGIPVLSDDNTREVLPTDVMEPPSPGPTVILVDCPTAFHIPSLSTASGLEPFFQRVDSSKTVTCIVHLSPAPIVSDPRYQSWMEKFGSTDHILAGKRCARSVSPILRSSAKILFKLNLACPKVFPVPGLVPDELAEQLASVKLGSGTVTSAEDLLKFRLRPLSALGMDTSALPEQFTGKLVKEQLLEKVPEISEAFKKLQELWTSCGPDLVEEPWLDTITENSHPSTKDVPNSLRGIGRKEMEVVFLGTGSSHPSSYRNVSSIYLHFFEKGGILLDCGEGTYSQLIRRFGTVGAQSVLTNMRCIWISHIHADHHGGLARILSMRRRVLADFGAVKPEPLLVVGPKLLKPLMEAYDKLEDLAMEFLDCSQTTSEAAAVAKAGGSKSMGPIGTSILQGSSGPMRRFWPQRGFDLRDGLDQVGSSKLEAVLEAVGLTSLLSVPVIHCPHAFGVVLEARSSAQRPGWKLAYSGDTRPCEQFIQASHGATMFIHEATFEDSMAQEAVAKRHSSTMEAIQSGTQAQAYRIILTHFSQRYSKVPVFDESYNSRTCIAFDLMSVNLADLPLLPSLVPVLKLLFKDEEEEEQEQVEMRTS